MKPEWKDAPEWANYLAMDANGGWFWYETEPEYDYDDGQWYRKDTVNLAIARTREPESRESLEKRP